MLPQPGLQRALCLWFALGRGPERHQRGAAADGLRHKQLTLPQHRPRAPGARHVCSGHPWRALEGDLRPPTSPDCQVARLVRGLERHPVGSFCCSYLIWSDHKRDGMRMGGIYHLTSQYPLDFSEGVWETKGRGLWCWEGGHLKWCHHSINHSITYLWSYWGSAGRVGRDKRNPIALNDPKDCHRKSPGNMQRHLHGNNQLSL